MNSAAPLAIILAAISVYMLRFRKAPAIKVLLIFMSLSMYLLLTTLLELNAQTDFWTKIFCHSEYIAFIYLPITWIMFALRTTGIVKKSNRLQFILLSFIPGILFILTIVFNDLLWIDIEYVQFSRYSFLRAGHGPLYWIIFSLAYIQIAGGTLLLLSSFLRSNKSNYRESIWFVLGSLMPGIANISYLFDFIPAAEIDFTPVGFAIAGILFFFAVYFHKMLWVLPVTRSLILQEMQRPILVLERRGWILDMNRSFERLLGIDKHSIGSNSLLSQPLRIFLERIGLTEENLQATPTQRTGRYIQGDKTYSWEIQTAGMPKHAMVIMLEDISDELQLEHQMYVLKDEFMKREKNATIGKLASGVAHEINNPLAFLKSNFRTLERQLSADRTARPESIAEIMESIHIGLDRIEDSARSLLDYSRSNRGISNAESFTLDDVCRQTIRFMQFEIRDHCRIINDLNSSIRLFGYPGQVSQVIFNILQNAVHAIEASGKSTSEGQICIQSRDESSRAVLEIENNGLPIDEQIAEHIFDLYFTTKSQEWGMGIGLSISREFIEVQNKGRIELLSRDPVIFRISLPKAADN